MKLSFFVPLALVASMTAAQSINIASPTDGQTVPSNQNVTLHVQLPDSQGPALQVPQLVIGVLACQTTDCSDVPGDAFLNTGGTSPQTVSFTPTRVDRVQPPSQNFSISLGSTAGTKMIRIMHVFGAGAGLQPTMELKSVRLVMADSATFVPRWKRT